MKLKSLMLTATSLVAFAIVACAQSVVFPTPLPTATPAPTATPIVFPTPLPTATPFSLPSPVPTATPAVVVFPTPLPTATPITLPRPAPTAPTATPIVFPTPLPTATPVVFPSPVPTATPAVVVFPTPLPTATPISLTINARKSADPFATISGVKVVPLLGAGRGTGFAFASTTDQCKSGRCILTAQHVAGVARTGRIVKTIRGGSFHGEGLWGNVIESDPQHTGLDIGVVYVATQDGAAGLTQFQFAIGDETVRVGQAVRVVALDIYDPIEPFGPVGTLVDQRVIDGIVSGINEPGIEFSITGDIWRGHSGSVVLDENMRVIGMVTRSLNINQAGRTQGTVARAVHVDAIRGKLCEWEVLEGADCR